MSSRKLAGKRSEPVGSAEHRIWLEFGREVREARRGKGWSVPDLALRSELSVTSVYGIEAGGPASSEAAARVASALGRRAELHLVDPRKREAQRDAKPNLSADLVHSAMGDLEAAHLRVSEFRVGIDEPYQHYQFAGRADLVAWDMDARALLHIENRTRFPDFQEMAGAFNAKRAYLASALSDRVGVFGWRSETHVIAALWSSEVVHALHLRESSFRTLCPIRRSHFRHGGRADHRQSASSRRSSWWIRAPRVGNEPGSRSRRRWPRVRAIGVMPTQPRAWRRTGPPHQPGGAGSRTGWGAWRRRPRAQNACRAGRASAR